MHVVFPFGRQDATIPKLTFIELLVATDGVKAVLGRACDAFSQVLHMGVRPMN